MSKPRDISSIEITFGEFTDEALEPLADLIIDYLEREAAGQAQEAEE